MTSPPRDHVAARSADEPCVFAVSERLAMPLLRSALAQVGANASAAAEYVDVPRLKAILEKTEDYRHLSVGFFGVQNALQFLTIKHISKQTHI